MGRLSRFESYRFVGVRETMTVYDCDNEAEFAELEDLVDELGLVDRNQLQSFSPDTLTRGGESQLSPVLGDQ